MMHIGLHHAVLHKKQKHHADHRKGLFGLMGLVDDSVYLFGLFGVAANVTQLWTVWTAKNIAGVSLVSWLGFFLGSIFWFSYGLFHKEKPIMIINAMLMIVQAGIVAGLLLHR